MKSFLKRYRMFLLLLVLNIALGIFLPKLGLKSLAITKNNVIEMISVIPPIFVLLGLLDVWVERETMMKYMGKASGFLGMLIAFLLGSAAAGPLYAAFPVAGVMLKKGSRPLNVFIFIGAWSTTKIPLLTFEASSLGIKFMLIRLVLNLLGILVIAYLIEKLLSKKDLLEVYAINEL